MSSDWWSNLYLSPSNPVFGNAWDKIIPFLFPIAAIATYFAKDYAPIWAGALGMAGAMVAMAVNLTIYQQTASLAQTMMGFIPGILMGEAIWLLSNIFFFPQYPSASAVLAGFVGYEGYIQTVERGNGSVQQKQLFWIQNGLGALIIFGLMR